MDMYEEQPDGQITPVSPEDLGHLLFVPDDFTDEEVERGNGLALAVVEGGLSVCKKCGGAEIELGQPCKAGRRVG